MTDLTFNGNPSATGPGYVDHTVQRVTLVADDPIASKLGRGIGVAESAELIVSNVEFKPSRAINCTNTIVVTATFKDGTVISNFTIQAGNAVPYSLRKVVGTWASGELVALR